MIRRRVGAHASGRAHAADAAEATTWTPLLLLSVAGRRRSADGGGRRHRRSPWFVVVEF